ncbi:hypothetical protein FA15DRAFT_655208 [Coprinopsis marcescibilis]|uniref:Uncharacterized protein n=1 Tax=Coprinopsis marcescibilis TaxID=230819 RepID=A0A5C3KYN2_COPMA|nr:hypothetical protein FA15DRAFT_655208 [Coprinopsis marcescibilis]
MSSRHMVLTGSSLPRKDSGAEEIPPTLNDCLAAYLEWKDSLPLEPQKLVTYTCAIHCGPLPDFWLGQQLEPTYVIFVTQVVKREDARKLEHKELRALVETEHGRERLGKVLKFIEDSYGYKLPLEKFEIGSTLQDERPPKRYPDTGCAVFSRYAVDIGLFNEFTQKHGGVNDVITRHNLPVGAHSYCFWRDGLSAKEIRHAPDAFPIIRPRIAADDVHSVKDAAHVDAEAFRVETARGGVKLGKFRAFVEASAGWFLTRHR